MSSTGERAKWLERHRELIREIRPDRADADAKLRLAERNLERARLNAEGDPDLALVAVESALVNVADAVLAAEGCVFGERRARTKRGFRIPACRAASAIMPP